MKLNIRRKMLILALSGSALTFVIMGVISFFALMMTSETVASREKVLKAAVTGFAEDFTGVWMKRRVSLYAAFNARHIQGEILKTRADAEKLARAMTLIASAKQGYEEVNLPMAGKDEVLSGDPYVNISRAVSKAEDSAALRREMRVASNIADYLKFLSGFYPSAYVGSKNGYIIAVDRSDSGGKVHFNESFFETYDPRSRAWYGMAEKARGPIMTDFYVDTNGVKCVTCAAPYYDEEGFAGAVGVDCNPEAIYQESVEQFPERINIESFVINSDGNIIFSSFKEGPLAVVEEDRDLRKWDDGKLSMEATAMVSGKSDVALVTIDGVKYFIAYEPAPLLGLSFGVAAKYDEVMYPVVFAGEIITSQIEDFAKGVDGQFLKILMGGTVALLAAMAASMAFGARTSSQVVEPILKLTEDVKEIARGNLDKKIEIKTGDEIEGLADCVNAMGADLKNYMENVSRMAADRERIKTELSVATDIQRGMLPREIPRFEAGQPFSLSARMTPAAILKTSMKVKPRKNTST